MEISWSIQARSADVVLEGLVEEPADGAEVAVPFVAEFSPRMLTGVAAYLESRQPWNLWVGADGGFTRDGGRCAIIALQFGWSREWEPAQVEIVASVRHDTSNDITANEPQRLVTFAGADLDRLRDDLRRIGDIVSRR